VLLLWVGILAAAYDDPVKSRSHAQVMRSPQKNQQSARQKRSEKAMRGAPDQVFAGENRQKSVGLADVQQA
jgi:hypothetical protein